MLTDNTCAVGLFRALLRHRLVPAHSLLLVEAPLVNPQSRLLLASLLPQTQIAARLSLQVESASHQTSQNLNSDLSCSVLVLRPATELLSHQKMTYALSCSAVAVLYPPLEQHLPTVGMVLQCEGEGS